MVNDFRTMFGARVLRRARLGVVLGWAALSVVFVAMMMESAWAQARNDRAARRDRSREGTSASGRSSGRASGSGGGTNAALTGELAAYSIIAERNIFNPNRGPRSSRVSQTNEPTAKPVVVETFSLVGTLIHGAGQFAFFDGSGSSYKKALRPQEAIGGVKLKEIGHNLVKLDVNGKEIELAIGMQMRRQDEGPWEVRGRPTVEVAKSSSAASADAGDEDEIVKKLMQKREKETNQ